jgi:hypothetical protein
MKVFASGTISSRFEVNNPSFFRLSMMITITNDDSGYHGQGVIIIRDARAPRNRIQLFERLLVKVSAFRAQRGTTYMSLE